jgi:hypothetical protein
MNVLDKKLTPILKQADSLPFLFVGSGFSQRYINLPDWSGLLEHISKLVNENDFAFAQAKQEASKYFNEKSDYNKYMTKLCDIISDRLNSVWYSSDKFKDSRTQYKKLVIEKNVPPIKIEIAKYIKKFQEAKIDPKQSNEFNCLKEISEHSIAGLITTNYDDLLEKIFDFETYCSQEELLFHQKYNLAEIYKIHGTVDQPDTILINSEDYKTIEKKHKYISAKLLTIFVEHPIFFLGYSIGDEDIQEILNDIQLSLGEEHANEISDRLFFIKWDSTIKDPIWSTHSITFSNRNTIQVRAITLNDYSDLYKILSKNKSKYPVKMLRYAKSDLYRYALTAKPSSKVVLSLPSKSLSAEQLSHVEFVYGFGIIERAKQGYSFVTSKEIFHDVLFDDGNFENSLLISGSLPPALRQSSGFLPIKKYTFNAPPDSLPEIVSKNLKRFSDFESFIPAKLNKRLTENGFLEYNNLKGSKDMLDNLAIVNWEEEGVEKLGDYLRDILDENIQKFDTRSTQIRRLIRIYDFYKYKKSRP